ncbi:MAG: uroporphyrinogen decarboxylase family protein [Clostridiales bacterium]|nr:uroporphyrinogen decarboxylase family protein [Clostridiales bacterium]
MKTFQVAENTAIPLMGVNGIHFSDSSLKEHLLNADIQFETIEKMVDTFKPDGMFAFMDLTVEAEALGMKIKYEDNENPSVIEHSIKNLDDLDKLKSEYKGTTKRMKVFIDVMKKMSDSLSIIKGAHVIGPFTLAGELLGVSELTMNTILDPSIVHECLNFTVEVITDYINELFEAGADVVSVLEPTAMMISPTQYEEFSLAPFKKILSNVNNKPLILHICGDTTHLIERMGTSGAVALSLDWQVNFKEAIKKIPEDVYLIGNLDPVAVFLDMDSDQVTKATLNLKGDMKNHKNFIMSSGCDLPIKTSDENIIAFMNAAKK